MKKPVQVIQQEELGMTFADLDTAVELMKKEEKMIIAELTVYYSLKGGYKNSTDLNLYDNFIFVTSKSNWSPSGSFPTQDNPCS